MKITREIIEAFGFIAEPHYGVYVQPIAIGTLTLNPVDGPNSGVFDYADDRRDGITRPATRVTNVEELVDCLRSTYFSRGEDFLRRGLRDLLQIRSGH